MMSSEDALCLLLARAELSPEARKHALSLLEGAVDWPRLFERAKKYQIFPLVYSGLRTLSFPGIPELVRSEWAKIFCVNAIRHELLATELAGILRLLGDAGIPAIPLKGIALAESLYGDLALRVCSDLDVLVPPHHAIDAFRIIVSAGYKPEFTQPRLLDLEVRYGRDCSMLRQAGASALAVDLHWGLAWGGPFERGLLGQVWAECTPVAFRGVPAFALSAEWDFLYLALHAARHGWLSLKWYADLDRLCRRGLVDWRKANEKARSLGWESAVQSSLVACSSVFETPLAPVFGLAPPPPRAYSRQPSELVATSDTLLLFRLLNTPARRLRYLAIRLLIPTRMDCEFLHLPPSLFFLYYALRPLRVTCKNAWWLVQAGLRSLGRVLRRSAENAG
jgi:hypothetical protein